MKRALNLSIDTEILDKSKIKNKSQFLENMLASEGWVLICSRCGRDDQLIITQKGTLVCKKCKDKK